jgi:hypothetical protein
VITEIKELIADPSPNLSQELKVAQDTIQQLMNAAQEAVALTLIKNTDLSQLTQ